MLLPECLDDFVGEDNSVRVVDAFIEELDLAVLGFADVVPEATGRPSYHPATLLKIYLYGYLNQVQSSRRLERETRRNLEMMWLTGRLTPDFKTIADFRRDNGSAIRAVCGQFVALCRRLDLLTHAIVAIDGSKFKAVPPPSGTSMCSLLTKNQMCSRYRPLRTGAARGAAHRSNQSRRLPD